jgi:hypothetical protein
VNSEYADSVSCTLESLIDVESSQRG